MNNEENKRPDADTPGECEAKDETCSAAPENGGAEASPEEPSEEKTETSAETSQEESGAAQPAEAKPEDEDLQTRFIRLSADFQNYKKRVEKEKSDIYAFANEKLVLQVLDVIDNFERAMETDAKDEGSTKFAEGMALIFKQLQSLLERNNVTEIPALGEVFDPKLHNAVMTESADGVESGTVTKVFQKGYMLNNKVIRASMVAVAQ